VTGDGTKLHNEELHNICFSRKIIRMMKSRRRGLAGYAARMREKRNNVEYWQESLKEGDH
jgi:hypothetical protein